MISYSGSPLAHSEGFPGVSTVTSQPLRRRRPGRTLAPEISVGDVARARDEREEKKSEPLVTSVIMKTLICHAPPPPSACAHSPPNCWTVRKRCLCLERVTTTT
ncbi:hypothetical protein ABVT39_011922 [Epinephelus coioides]